MDRQTRSAVNIRSVYAELRNVSAFAYSAKSLYTNATLANLFNLEKIVNTKLIASTDAQNNFGRVLDDVTHNGTRYVIRRRNTSQAIILSLTDFESILSATEPERKRLEKKIKELSPVYSLGESIDER